MVIEHILFLNVDRKSYMRSLAPLLELAASGLKMSNKRLKLEIALNLLALLDCVSRANAVARESVVRCPSVKRIFSETVKQINAKFCGKVATHHISRPVLALLDYVSLKMLKAIWRSFGALVLIWPVTRKRLAVERNGVTFGTRWYLQHVYGGTFDLLVLNVILGSFVVLVSKWAVT